MHNKLVIKVTYLPQQSILGVISTELNSIPTGLQEGTAKNFFCCILSPGTCQEGIASAVRSHPFKLLVTLPTS